MIKKLVFLLIGFSLYSCGRSPEFENPKQFKFENIEFSYPNNWYEGKNGKEDNIGFKWTNIKSPDNFVFGIQHYNKKYDYNLEDLADNYLKNLMTKMEGQILKTEFLNRKEKIKLQLMRNEVEGIQIEYKNKLLNVVIDQKTIFFQYVTDSCTCIFTATTNIEDWKKEQSGFDIITKTLIIK